MSKFEEGDRVMFAASWLRNTGQLTGEVPFMEGTVTEVEDLLDTDRELVTVDWGEGGVFPSLGANLVRKDRRHLEPA